MCLRGNRAALSVEEDDNEEDEDKEDEEDDEKDDEEDKEDEEDKANAEADEEDMVTFLSFMRDRIVLTASLRRKRMAASKALSTAAGSLGSFLSSSSIPLNISCMPGRLAVWSKNLEYTYQENERLDKTGTQNNNKTAKLNTAQQHNTT